MRAYNRVNGEFADENRQLIKGPQERVGLRGLRADRLGLAQQSTGTPPTTASSSRCRRRCYSPPSLAAAVATGQVALATIDLHVRRILRTMFAYGMFDRDAYRYDDDAIDQAGPRAVAREVEEAAIDAAAATTARCRSTRARRRSR